MIFRHNEWPQSIPGCPWFPLINFDASICAKALLSIPVMRSPVITNRFISLSTATFQGYRFVPDSGRKPLPALNRHPARNLHHVRLTYLLYLIKNRNGRSADLVMPIRGDVAISNFSARAGA